jgi:hypothetical protein
MKFINNACIDEGSILVDKALAKVIQNKHLMSKNLSCVTIIPNDYFLSKRVRANSKLVTKSWQLNIRQCDEYTFFWRKPWVDIASLQPERPSRLRCGATLYIE